MSFIKALGNDLTVSLLSEDPFLYAHLVKFERVPSDTSGQIREVASDYSYITDASFDIEFNDSSSSLAGDANGTQTYIANRLTQVSNVSETTEAKVSNVNLTISSIGLDSKFVGTSTNTVNIAGSSSLGCAITISGDSWTDLGFSEGDKIVLDPQNSSNSNTGISLTISAFTTSNYTANCILPSSTTTNVTGGTNYIITLETDEVAAILDDPASASYNGYINREVTIYKAHIDPSTGSIIGAPYTFFKGIISKAKLSDDPTKNSIVNWTLTSHWGDFIRVNGRITSDSEHRALGTNGNPDLGALYRDDYARDLGFMHGEQAINIMSVYQVKETRYKLKKSGWLFKKYKQVEYQVEVDREVDLRINLEAKYLPVIYGVQRTDSVPIFADSLQNDPTTIYVAYAICEGEVSGLYDIYIDDQSRICIDKNDSDVRSTNTEDGTIEVVCEGRMDKGDTLSSAPSSTVGVSIEDYINNPGAYIPVLTGDIMNGGSIVFKSNNSPLYSLVNSSAGIIHKGQTSFETPIPSTLVFHAGRSHQRADDSLAAIGIAGAASAANGFKLQGDAEDSTNYWTKNHRLLDTAYVVAKYKIGEGDITIPKLDFVVRGREIEQYDYDYSYTDHPNPPSTTTATAASFKLGDTVNIYSSSSATPSTALSQVQIVDYTIYYNAANLPQHKFRFSNDPLGGDTSINEFYMQRTSGTGPGDRYSLVTWDYKSHSGTVPSALVQDVTETVGDGNATIANTAVSAGTGVDITQIDNEIQQAIILAAGNLTGLLIGGESFSTPVANLTRLAPNSVTSSGVTTLSDVGGTQNGKDNVDSLVVLNAIKLDSAASTVDDYYNGQTITVVNTDATTGVQKRQSRKIVDYNGSTKVAHVGELFDSASEASTAATVTTTVLYPVDYAKEMIVTTLAQTPLDKVISSTSSQATIPAGTRVTAVAINGNITTLTLSNTVSVNRGAVISLQDPPSATTQSSIEPTEFDFIPSQGDTFEIASSGNKKVSINPAIQLLDYLTNGRYGRGLNLAKDINLDSFKLGARLCDTRSDINLILPNAGTYTVGAKWKYSNTIDSVSYLQWQGTIESVVDAGTGYKQVTFTDCIGKMAHKWFDWKSYEIGNSVYHKVGGVNKVYLVSESGTIAEPATSSTNFNALAITNVSTSATVNVHGVSSAGASESSSGERDNPVVKSWNGGSNYEKSGYTLYDSDDVKYWRYMGWQEQNQREVTRHQTNAIIRTDTPLFDNVNSMLKHFNGILRYSNGKYELDVESTAPTIPATSQIITSSSYTGSAGASNTSNYRDPRIINEGDIIGAITVDDSGLKGIANSVSVSISDPNIRYDNRSVSFFKSEYLKEDRNIPKKKDIKTPLITNYFNARINAEQYLDQSRFSRKINFVIGPKGVLLLAGTIIKLSYYRFGWVNKEFRISNLSYRPDCSVQVTAEEHNNDTYIITAKNKDYSSVGEAGNPGDRLPVPPAPEQLSAVGGLNSVALSWANANVTGIEGSPNPEYFTEIFYNNHESFTNQTADTKFYNGAVLLNTNQGLNDWEHPLAAIEADTTFYYWIRHTKRHNIAGKVITKKSVFHPLSTANGVSATAIVSASGGVIYMYKSSVDEPTDDPSDDALFPTLLVDLSGVNAGKITSVGAEPDGFVGTYGADITENQVIDTAGEDTGWYIVPQSPTIPDEVTDARHSVWIIAATGSSVGASDEILRGEWTEPVRFNGSNGLNTAKVELYKLGNVENAPADPTGSLVYTFSDGTLATNNLNGWSQTAQSPTITNKYLWKITAAAISYEDTYTIPTEDWATAIRDAQVLSGTSIGVFYLYKNSSTDISASTSNAIPDNITTFPTLVVNVSGATAGTFNDVATSQGSAAITNGQIIDTAGVATGWYTSPVTPANGEKQYVIVASGNSTSATDQIGRSEWSTASQFSGGDGLEGISVVQLSLFKATSTNVAPSGSTMPGACTWTFASKSFTSGPTTGWSLAQPEVSSTNAYIWNTTVIAKNDPANATPVILTAPIEADDWSTPLLVNRYVPPSTTPGPTGPNGLRTIQGYLYFESTSGTPSAPTGNTYDFSSGLVEGVGIGTVTAVNTWTNSPRTQDPTSSNTHYTVRYYGTESAAGSTGIAVTYSSVVPYTDFTGVVTFSGGTFSEGTTAITTIDGGNIATNTIQSEQLQISSLDADPGTSSTASGIFLDGASNSIKIFAGGILRVKIGNL